jgi:hypothetical protein
MVDQEFYLLLWYSTADLGICNPPARFFFFLFGCGVLISPNQYFKAVWTRKKVRVYSMVQCLQVRIKIQVHPCNIHRQSRAQYSSFASPRPQAVIGMQLIAMRPPARENHSDPTRNHSIRKALTPLHLGRIAGHRGISAVNGQANNCQSEGDVDRAERTSYSQQR